MNREQFLASVASKLLAGLNPYKYAYGVAADYLFAERDDFGLAIVVPVQPDGTRGGLAVCVQRFDSREFGNPGWYCWFGYPDNAEQDATPETPEPRWFAGLDATPETVAAERLRLF